MSGRFWRRVGLCLALAGLAGCGIKGDPAPAEPPEQAGVMPGGDLPI